MNGIINVYKEKGFTSHDVVAKLRGILKTKKIGHTGTLDPDAEGVLPVCVGKATKLCDMLTEKTKTYHTVLLLGKITDTQDVTGTVIDEKTVPSDADVEKIKDIINSFTGEYAQVPPMYSALKVNGKKLYELARQGVTVERKPRNVIINSIKIESIELPRIEMTVDCSKGTYIRTLCHDIGEKTGYGGCMESLLRTRTGMFELKNAVKLDDIQKFADEDRISEILMPVDSVFCNLKKCVVKEQFNILIYNGNMFVGENLVSEIKVTDAEDVRVYDESDNFIGIYKYNDANKCYKPVKMFLVKE